jgi:hypothetical protein
MFGLWLWSHAFAFALPALSSVAQQELPSCPAWKQCDAESTKVVYDGHSLSSLQYDAKLLPCTTPSLADPIGAVRTIFVYDTYPIGTIRAAGPPRAPPVDEGEFLAVKSGGALTYGELRQAGVNLTDRMSGNQFKKLVESIKQNGLQDKVINYVKLDGEIYVVLGNNRVQAARQLGITDQLIFKEVQLPFRGFKTENDVINAAAEVIGGH